MHEQFLSFLCVLASWWLLSNLLRNSEPGKRNYWVSGLSSAGVPMRTHGSLGIFIIFIYLLILTIFIGVELLYTVVLASDAQQYESVTHTHSLFWISFPFRSPQSTEFPVLHSRFSWASILYIVVYSVNPNLPVHPPSTFGIHACFAKIGLSEPFF